MRIRSDRRVGARATGAPRGRGRGADAYRVTLARAGACAAGLALLALPAGARAQQLDTNPPIPNVLLLLDNSGSMDREIDGTLPEDTAANNCNCNAATGVCNWSATPANVNRWGTVQQAMTGTLANGYDTSIVNPAGRFAYAQLHLDIPRH